MDFLFLLTIFIGLVGAIRRKNLILKTLSMDVMGTGVIGYFLLIASRSGTFTPTISESVAAPAYADPVPQAVILTAIVIGFSIVALLLVCLMVLSRHYPTLDIDDIETMQGLPDRRGVRNSPSVRPSVESRRS